MATLPEEILEAIFIKLQPRSRVVDFTECSNEQLSSTLAAICLVRKSWYRIAMPLLYHTVEVYGLVSRRHCSSLNVSRTTFQLGCFLTALLRNRKLASHVKNLKVELTHAGDHVGDDRREFDQVKLCDELLQLWPLKAWKRRNIMKMVEHWHGDAELAVLVPLCNELESLELIAPEIKHFEELMTTALALQRNCRTSPLPKLSTLALHPKARPKRADEALPKDLAELIRLPTIKTLFCAKMACILQHRQERLANITRIHLEDAAMYPLAFPRLFSAFSNLIHLEVRNIEPGHCPFSPESLGSLLQQCATRLVTLTLVLKQQFLLSFIPWTHGPLGALVNLRHLTTTRIALIEGITKRIGSAPPPGRLANTLPVGLETLCIEMCSEIYYEYEPEEAPLAWTAYRAEGQHGFDQFWSPLWTYVTQYCSTAANLRQVELKGLVPEQHNISIPGWSVTKLGSVLLTRD